MQRRFQIQLLLAGLYERDVALIERLIGAGPQGVQLIANRLLFTFQPVNIGQPHILLGGKFGGLSQGLLTRPLPIGLQARDHRVLRLRGHMGFGQDRTEQGAQVAQLFIDLFRGKIGRGLALSRRREPGMQALGRAPHRTVAFERCPLGVVAQLGGQEPVSLDRGRRRAAGQGHTQLALNPAQIGPPVAEQMIIGDKDPRRVPRVALRRNHIARPEQQRLLARKAIALGQRGGDLERIAHHHHIARRIARQLQRRTPEPAQYRHARVLQDDQGGRAIELANRRRRLGHQGLVNMVGKGLLRPGKDVIPRRAILGQDLVIDPRHIGRFPKAGGIVDARRHQVRRQGRARQGQETRHRRGAGAMHAHNHQRDLPPRSFCHCHA